MKKHNLDTRTFLRYWVRTFKDSRGRFAIGNRYREFPREKPFGIPKGPLEFHRYLGNSKGPFGIPMGNFIWCKSFFNKVKFSFKLQPILLICMYLCNFIHTSGFLIVLHKFFPREEIFSRGPLGIPMGFFP